MTGLTVDPRLLGFLDDRRIPTEAEVVSLLEDGSNWGRWGSSDERGALNLVDAKKRGEAAALVRTGRSVSLSRAWATQADIGVPNPAHHYMKSNLKGRGGAAQADEGAEGAAGWAADYFGNFYHGWATTHLDALCHIWGPSGQMYNGRAASEEIGFDGAGFGGVEKWADGLITRGVLLDVVEHRGTFVTQDEPVHGWELEDIVSAQDIELRPGDAICVRSGREEWQAANPNKPYGRFPFDPCCGGSWEKPGLHASCLAFLKRYDVSVLVWDMADMTPFDYDIPFTVHAAIYAFGVALVDNAVLGELAVACADEGRKDFMVVVAPLVVKGGTGSPVNPLVLF